MGAEPRALSPAHHLRQNLPPTIIFQGTADTTARFSTAEAYAERVRALGNRCELKSYADQGHGFFNYGRPGGYYDQTLAEADRFLGSLGGLEAR